MTSSVEDLVFLWLVPLQLPAHTLGSIVPLLFWGVLVVPCLFVSLAEVAAVDADEVALDTIRAAFEATERALQVFF